MVGDVVVDRDGDGVVEVDDTPDVCVHVHAAVAVNVVDHGHRSEMARRAWSA